MVADKFKHLQEQMGIAQSELAKKLGITRASVNARCIHHGREFSLPHLIFPKAPGDAF